VTTSNLSAKNVKCVTVLRSDESLKFERLFPDFRDCLLETKCLDASIRGVKNDIKLVHQLVFELLDKKIKAALQAMKTLEFREIAEKMTSVRSVGHGVADHFSFFREQLALRNILSDDPWLEDLVKLIDRHFQAGRDLGGIKYFAVLRIAPSSRMDNIKKAFKAKSLEYHQDKCRKAAREREFKEKFQLLNQAVDELPNRSCNRDHSKPFDKEIRGIGNFLRNLSRRPSSIKTTTPWSLSASSLEKLESSTTLCGHSWILKRLEMM
jgi:hypothetical protein